MDTNTPAEAVNTTDLLEVPMPEYKIFSINQMIAGTVFGGPLVAAYMVASNFKKQGLGQHVWKSWAIQISILILSFIPDFTEAGDPLPSVFYTVLFAFGAYLMAKNLQGKLIEIHFSGGGQFWETGRVVLVVVLSILFYIFLVAGVFMLSDWEGFKEIFKNR